jgi:hypothetical protein
LAKGNQFENYWLDMPDEALPKLNSIFTDAGASSATTIEEVVKN